MEDEPASKQIDQIVASTEGWRGETLAALRREITTAQPEIGEAVKYKKPSQPAGVPFWVLEGDVCFANVLKEAVRLTFSKGAQLPAHQLFNTRLDSKVVRAVDLAEGDVIDSAALRAVLQDAVELNRSKAKSKR